MLWRSIYPWATIAALLSMLTSTITVTDDEYTVGVGIADVTGPRTQLGFLGYANPSQIGEGIHMRLFSRAIIIKSPTGQPVVYVAVDLAMMDTGVKLEVVQKLKDKFGSTYTLENVLISATHTHSGPAGYMKYLLYGITSGGFDEQNFDAIVDGIVKSITKAHENMQKARMSISTGKLDNANINRSPSAYLQNPEEERSRYNSDVDQEMVQLQIYSLGTGELMGLINWFAVHLTSMNNTNKLVSSDNKGYAAQLLEQEMNPPGTTIGTGKFVAAFASTNLGDVSPNTKGARCIDTGDPCNFYTSTCPPLNDNLKCIASGPGPNSDMKESTRIIGERQYKMARQLLDQTNVVTVKGPTGFVHQSVDMSNYKVTLENGTTVITCPAALGFSFAAGTTDGPGAFPFTQGATTNNPFWNLIRTFIKAPLNSQIECQYPKPILLDVGEMHFPYDWVANIVETQMLRVGNLHIISFPGELTTMAGRRLRETVKKLIIEKGGAADAIVVIAGLSNTYSHYCTTFEEYQVQRYEGASTLYGPHTLSAYLQQYSMLTNDLVDGTTPEKGPELPVIKNQISLLPPIFIDAHLPFQKFGDCTQQPPNVVFPGQTVVVKFVSGNPRNNPLTGDTFFTVEYNANETVPFKVIATDANWSTQFRWTQLIPLIGASEIEFRWEIPLDVSPGLYRIRHFGYFKGPFSTSPYDGSTNTFQVGV